MLNAGVWCQKGNLTVTKCLLCARGSPFFSTVPLSRCNKDPILKTRKPKLRELKQLGLDHTAGGGQVREPGCTSHATHDWSRLWAHLWGPPGCPPS